ncbi:MAG: hypothetical protein ACI4U2_06485 [Christensenellaceae bacterium]
MRKTGIVALLMAVVGMLTTISAFGEKILSVHAAEVSEQASEETAGDFIEAVEKSEENVHEVIQEYIRQSRQRVLDTYGILYDFSGEAVVTSYGDDTKLNLASELAVRDGVNINSIRTIIDNAYTAAQTADIRYPSKDLEQDAYRHFGWNFSCMKDGITDNVMRIFTADYEWADY